MKKDYLELGQIVGTHGIKGEIRVNPWCDSPDFAKGFKTVYFDNKGTQAVKVTACRPHGNVILMKLENICYDDLEKGYSGKNGRVHETVGKIVDYVEEHFRENFDSNAIERDLLINFDYANRIFKKHTGYSIIKYRNRLRINTAKALMVTTSLIDIATDVGFSSVYYFSRCFKSFEGMSPEKYREFIKLGEGQKAK